MPLQTCKIQGQHARVALDAAHQDGQRRQGPPLTLTQPKRVAAAHRGSQLFGWLARLAAFRPTNRFLERPSLPWDP